MAWARVSIHHPEGCEARCACAWLHNACICSHGRSSGDSSSPSLPPWYLQSMIAAICSLGQGLHVGGNAAKVQMVVVASLQAVVGSYMLWRLPSADRLMSWLVGVQFLMEGAVTITLLASSFHSDADEAEGLQRIAFVLSVVALLAPVLQRLYDAVIVQISKLVRADGFTVTGAVFAMIGFVVFLPTVLSRAFGVDTNDSSLQPTLKLVEGAGDDVNKLATKTANEGVVTQIEAGVGEIASNLWWVTHQDAKSRREANARLFTTKLKNLCESSRAESSTSARSAAGSTRELTRRRPNSGGILLVRRTGEVGASKTGDEPDVEARCHLPGDEPDVEEGKEASYSCCEDAAEHSGDSCSTVRRASMRSSTGVSIAPGPVGGPNDAEPRVSISIDRRSIHVPAPSQPMAPASSGSADPDSTGLRAIESDKV